MSQNNPDSMNATFRSETVAPLAVGLLSDHATEIFKIVNYVVLSTAISIFGIAANTLNMCVLFRQGFASSMNVSFFGMAVSDMGSLLTLLWLNACLSPFIRGVFNEIHYLFGAWLHGCAARITGWITVYITAERCLSIARPLHVKRMVTPGRTAAIIAIIYIVNLLTLVPEVSTVYFDWRVVSAPIRSPKSAASASSTEQENGGMTVEGLVFAVHAALTLMSFVGLVTLTFLLVASIRRKSLWRKTAAADRSGQQLVSARDRKTVTLVITVSSLLIACYVPTVSFSIVTACVPAFSLRGSESNVFYVAWSFAFITHSVNSSIIVLLYYRMSTKYRRTCRQILARCFGRVDDRDDTADIKLEHSSIKF